MPYDHILASRTHSTLYIGVSNDIARLRGRSPFGAAKARRVWEHRHGVGSRFVKKYRVTRLFHVEPHADIARAIQREKTLKEWPRAWKIRPIERGNPEWDDLYDQLNG